MPRKIRFQMTSVKVAGLLVGLAALIIFNIYTNVDTLVTFLGASIGTLAFALAISLLDLFGLARVITTEDQWGKEPSFVYISMGVWALVVVVDIFFTALWVMLRMDTHAMTSELPEAAVLITLFPWGLAITEALIRIPLVLTLGYYGEKTLHRKAQTSTPYYQAPRRPPTSAPAPGRGSQYERPEPQYQQPDRRRTPTVE